MKLWGYDGQSGTFRMYYENEWRADITVAGAVRYLTEQLRQSIINDFETAYFAYIEKGTGFYGSLRILLPNLTFLGTLFKGRDNSRNVVEFIRRYLGSVNNEYQHLGDLLYAIYRHGLAHTNMPKIIFVNGWNVGWVITFDNEHHLSLTTIGLKDYNIWISPFQLYIDLRDAIDIYIEDLKKSDNILLFNSFKDGYVSMAKYHNRNNIGMNCNAGFDYLREKIQEYQESQD